MIERTGRLAAPAAVALFVIIGIAQTEQPLSLVVPAGLVAVAAAVTLSLTSARGWTLVAGAAVALAGVAVVCSRLPSNLGWFAICVLAGWCALRASMNQAITFATAAIALLVAEWIFVDEEHDWGPWIAGTVFTTIVCILARRQADLIEQLREAQAGLAERTRAEERNRIAGEMHDVIGHALTVSLLHVSSARLALDEDPDEARACLAEAERLGQQSLAEVRQAVGMLREHSSGSVAPLPDASALPELVESFRRTASTVHLEVVGDPADLPTTTGLAVYRIAQESLTNIARHVPGATAWLRLEVTAGSTRMTVEDDGRGSSDRAAPAPSGVGILNMRERAESLGGRLVAGPSGAGWRVEAVLPGTQAEESR